LPIFFRKLLRKAREFLTENTIFDR